MVYKSQNTLPPATRIQDVRDFVSLLGYTRSRAFKSERGVQVEEYQWFDQTDYRSWSGVAMWLYRNELATLVVEIQTPMLRSYYDLTYQNFTISNIHKRFGGSFATNEGRARYQRPTGGPPPPPASGCYLAFARFGSNLLKAKSYIDARDFPKHPPRANWKGIESFQEYDPRTLANNALVPFLVAMMEDYFKSSFIALLRYSPQKEAFLKEIRLQGAQLLAISDGKATVEEQISEILPFQRISAVCRHFKKLDPKLDIAAAMRKPYHRRSKSLFDTLDDLVTSRHDFIHRAILDKTMTDDRLEGLIYDLDAAITRVYQRITDHYRWSLFRSSFLSRRPSKKASINTNTMPHR